MISVRAQKGNWMGNVELLVIDRSNEGVIRYGRNIPFDSVEPGEASEPTLAIPFEAAQQLMDDLWICGLRPSEGAGSAGSLRATQDHLADMRKIAFQLMEK